MEIKVADVAELVDARDLKSLDGNVVWLQVPPPAPRFALTGYAGRSHAEAVRAKCVRRSLSAAKAKTDCPKHSEVGMPDDEDDLFGKDGDEAIADFDRLTEILLQRIVEFAEQEDVADDMLSLLLLRHALTMRMAAYAATAAKPSGGGLKLDLDRFRRDIEDLIRATKKDADRFIADAKASIAAA